MKQAGRETRRFQALATAWELKEIKHYGKLVQELHQTDYEELKEYDAMVDEKDHVTYVRDNVAGIMAYKHEVYHEETLSFDTAEMQLNQLEEEVNGRLALNLCSSPHEADDLSDRDNDDEDTGGEEYGADNETTYTQNDPQHFNSNYQYLLGNMQHLPNDYGPSIHSAAYSHPPINYHTSTTSQSTSVSDPYPTYSQMSTSADVASAFTPYPTIYNQSMPMSPNVPPSMQPDIDQRTMHPYLTIYTQSSPTSADVPPSTLSDIDQRLMHDRQVPTLFPSCYSPYANVYAECILRRGESVWGEAHECISDDSVIPDSQKSVRKSNKLHPAPAQRSESSTTIPLMLMSTTVIPQPTSSKNPPTLNDTPTSTLKAEAREALQWYFLLQQPMQDDDLYICDLADDLAKKYIPEPHRWEQKQLNMFHSTSKSILKEIMNHFKVTALTTMQDMYSLRIPIKTQGKLSNIWKMQAEDLLHREDFADVDMTVSRILQF
ncbi:hypothetical protein SCLCIDRAFT_6459 [Scleroderma citrinum Foug A]|uniref:Uncharacterized protein n=1 Tax=Scleroderma citrinum Foug A TaxID=1036808 RepID=A0A0C3EQV5_9AGAM|nr:hypothetical protein SCLCIDRAFT_6459 [Scleroderma citrinum Foug A]